MKTKNVTPKVEHTPTPWEVNGNAITSFVADQHIVINKEADELWKRNAAYIVKCVNSHEELLIALKALRLILVNYNQHQNSAINHIGGIQIHWADKAIAKAEGH